LILSLLLSVILIFHYKPDTEFKPEVICLDGVKFVTWQNSDGWHIVPHSGVCSESWDGK
jgi:hypothetical protein